MKREQFLITSTESHSVVKYKWNSANREVENLIGEIANQDGSRWSLVQSESEKFMYRVLEFGKEQMVNKSVSLLLKLPRNNQLAGCSKPTTW